MDEEFEALLREGAAADVDGWGFDFLEGRATEERPPWGYARLLSARWGGARAALDLQTGGGEVLAEAAGFPPLAVATESWAPNLAQATARLHPLGVAVVEVPDGAALPFAQDAFDLVTSRHPATIPWHEIHRVLRPEGTYLAQHVGPASMIELIEAMLGPGVMDPDGRHPAREVAAAEAAGLEVVEVREARLRVEILDVAAVVYLLRKVIWWVPGFTVEAYRDQLAALHEQLRLDGVFLAHSTRHLLEARKPAGR